MKNLLNLLQCLEQWYLNDSNELACTFKSHPQAFLAFATSKVSTTTCTNKSKINIILGRCLNKHGTSQEMYEWSSSCCTCKNLQNVCIANHFFLENFWKNILLNCPGGITLTTHLRAYVLSTKVKKPWKQKTKIKVYGESSFDDMVVVDENPNYHKISKPNALHFIFLFIIFFLFSFPTMQILAILPYTMEVLPRHSWVS